MRFQVSSTVRSAAFRSGVLSLAKAERQEEQLDAGRANGAAHDHTFRMPLDQHGAGDPARNQRIKRPRGRSMALVRRLPLLLAGPDL